MAYKQLGSFNFSMSPEDWKKIGKGFLIALAGAALTYATSVFIPSLEDSGNAVLLTVAAVVSVLVNTARKFLTDTTN